MRPLIDTDAFCKLGASDLLVPAVEVLGATLTDCARLPALPNKLRRGSLAKLFGTELAAKLLPIAQSIAAAPAPHGPWEARLADVVDPGEALLLALTAEAPETAFVSGDKRALRGALGLPGLAPVVQGRIVVIEALVLAVCERDGVESVAERISPARPLDMALNVCFSSADPAASLRQYLADLRRELPPDVLWGSNE